MAKRTNRTGERFITNEGYEIIIVEYNNANDLWIEFQDEHGAKIHSTYNNCIKKEIKNPYHPSIYGVGYIGQGKYKPSINGKLTKCYNTWNGMMRRGFDEKFKNKYPTYKNVTVCKEWYNFQNFSKWFEDNYYEVENKTMNLDKDILTKGNKIYTPDTCVFVPQRINTLFTKNDFSRGNLPIGVYYNKNSNKYIAECSIVNKNGNKIRKPLGYYDTSEEAFLAYKEFKEAYIKQVADEYKDKIPQRLYDAMYVWEVEING